MGQVQNRGQVQNQAEDQQKIYQRWAPVYDQVYRGLLRDGHRTLARLAADAGTDILEIGVGTGLVLSHYPRRSRVTGIDISEHMIARAREKVVRQKLFHIRQLQVMDAHALTFEDQSFDAVCLPFVITLIPEPERALDECARVFSGQVAKSFWPASSAMAPACKARSRRPWRRLPGASAGAPPSGSAGSPTGRERAVSMPSKYCRFSRMASSRSSA
jgi:ubiquinone/menaquinone biosynthesis C-methylase UbiE